MIRADGGYALSGAPRRLLARNLGESEPCRFDKRDRCRGFNKRGIEADSASLLITLAPAACRQRNGWDSPFLYRWDKRERC